MRYVISYVSTQSKELKSCEVVEILYETEIRNDSFGVNGLLIYSEGNFFEVIEGEQEKIKDLYRHILKDDRHKDVILLFQKEIHKALFKDEDSHFISENTMYKKMEVEHFEECIQDLDIQTKTTINNILKVMGTQSHVG